MMVYRGCPNADFHVATSKIGNHSIKESIGSGCIGVDEAKHHRNVRRRRYSMIKAHGTPRMDLQLDLEVFTDKRGVPIMETPARENRVARDLI
jgi:hypothetical protein